MWGGVYAPNVGSAKVFLKNKYKLECTRIAHCLFNGKYIDCQIYCRFNE